MYFLVFCKRGTRCCEGWVPAACSHLAQGLFAGAQLSIQLGTGVDESFWEALKRLGVI